MKIQAIHPSRNAPQSFYASAWMIEETKASETSNDTILTKTTLNDSKPEVVWTQPGTQFSFISGKGATFVAVEFYLKGTTEGANPEQNTPLPDGGSGWDTEEEDPGGETSEEEQTSQDTDNREEEEQKEGNKPGQKQEQKTPDQNTKQTTGKTDEKPKKKHEITKPATWTSNPEEFSYSRKMVVTPELINGGQMATHTGFLDTPKMATGIKVRGLQSSPDDHPTLDTEFCNGWTSEGTIDDMMLSTGQGITGLIAGSVVPSTLGVLEIRQSAQGGLNEITKMMTKQSPPQQGRRLMVIRMIHSEMKTM